MYAGDPRISVQTAIDRLAQRAKAIRAVRRPVTFGGQVAQIAPRIGRAQHAQISRLVGRLRARR